MRVLVVDDTALFRRVISDALAGVPGVEVVGTSANGKLALSRLPSLRPDLITLDIDMPEMNGLEFLANLKDSGHDAGVVLLSSLTTRGGELTIRGLELGAFDFLLKPAGGSAEENLLKLREGLLPIVKAFEQRRGRRLGARTGTSKQPSASGIGLPGEEVPVELQTGRPRDRRSGPPLVLIGVSTGGPAALATVFSTLPADLGAPVFVVQHMPPMFTKALASNLASRSSLSVKEAADGERALSGTVYLAPGGRQMKIDKGSNGEIVIRITEDAAENNCKPAVDYLFRSAALNFPGRSIAVVLTGMGKDGTQGLKLLKRSGCFSVAQNEASCVVYGMPKEAILAGVVDIVVPLDEVGPSIVRELREPRS